MIDNLIINEVEYLLRKYYPTDPMFLNDYTFKGIEGLESVVAFGKTMGNNLKILQTIEYCDDGFTIVADEGFKNYLNLFCFFVRPEARKGTLKDEMFQNALNYAVEHGKQLIAQVLDKNKPIMRFYGARAKKSFPSTFEGSPSTYFCF